MRERSGSGFSTHCWPTTRIQIGGSFPPKRSNDNLLSVTLDPARWNRKGSWVTNVPMPRNDRSNRRELVLKLLVSRFEFRHPLDQPRDCRRLFLNRRGALPNSSASGREDDDQDARHQQQ